MGLAHHIALRWRWFLVVSGLALIAAVNGASANAGSTTTTSSTSRSSRCEFMEHQLAEALTHNAGTRVTRAAERGKEAKELCAAGKQSQGLRAYAKALQDLGVKPVQPM